MPYRVKSGQEVMLLYLNANLNIVTFKRTVDFILGEIIASPLDEHRESGIVVSPYEHFPWGFDVTGKWVSGDAADKVKSLFATEVHRIDVGMGVTVNTMVIPGGGTNNYTVTFDAQGGAIKCTCPVFRFKRNFCKHMVRAEERYRDSKSL